ncbi:MAG: 1,4-alpha-glucan branching enzyme, partial [Actinobacteria bacterium]|nr:1,4-alpha-glucan branching enzyme [Actinomycetota bacterium]
QALFEYADPRLGRHPEWGSRVFDFGRNEVRAFLTSSARWWIEHFHIDGLRVDAVASMIYRNYARPEGAWIPNVDGGRENYEAISFVRQLNDEIHTSAPGVLMIAEESTAFPGVTAATSDGGLGFDLKWDLGWMHDTLDYLARDSVHRSWHQNDLTFRAMYGASERFVLPLSHDEVVHGKASLASKMAGDEWQRQANLRALFALQWTTPGVPLLFMGGELAMNEEWNHDAELPWWLLQHDAHRGVQRWVGELNRLLRAHPALSASSSDVETFAWLDCSDSANSVLSWVRRESFGGRDTVVVIANLTPVPHEGYRIAFPEAGTWSLIGNSDNLAWNGSGYPLPSILETETVPWSGWQQSAMVTLPPLAVTIWSQE